VEYNISCFYNFQL